MSNDSKPEVRLQPAPVVPAPAVDLNSEAFKAAVAAAVQAALIQIPKAPSADVNQELLAAVLRREQRETAEAQSKEMRIAQKQVQAGKNAQMNEHETREKQRRCKHVKGGKLQKPGFSDYNFSMHTFPDHERVIKCNNCSMKWKQRDTKEFIYRDGKKYRNHTGLGWHEVFTYLGQSSNQPSSSEVILSINPDTNQVLSQEDNAKLQARKQAEADLYSKPVEDAETVQK
jgi:hypothetical protein